MVELREIVLRDKPEEFLKTSPSATVPALRCNGTVLDESLDIMIWALKQNDPDKLLEMPKRGWELISTNDGPFKAALDHTKYATRYPDLEPAVERAKASEFISTLDTELNGKDWLFGDHPTLADFAILPFIRQFANVDRDWFDGQGWSNARVWLDRFMESGLFVSVMPKFAPWIPGDSPVLFGKSQ